MGSILFLAAWSVMMGPIQYGKHASLQFWLRSCIHVTVADGATVQHLISGPRLPFTAAYFGSIALTLYFSLGVSLPFPSILDFIPTRPAQPLLMYPTHPHHFGFRLVSFVYFADNVRVISSTALFSPLLRSLRSSFPCSGSLSPTFLWVPLAYGSERASQEIASLLG